MVKFCDRYQAFGTPGIASRWTQANKDASAPLTLPPAESGLRSGTELEQHLSIQFTFL